MIRGTIPPCRVAIRVHDMTGDDLGIARVPTPVETGDIILLDRGEYRVLDVISVDDARSPLRRAVDVDREVAVAVAEGSQ